MCAEDVDFTIAAMSFVVDYEHSRVNFFLHFISLFHK